MKIPVVERIPRRVEAFPTGIFIARLAPGETVEKSVRLKVKAKDTEIVKAVGLSDNVLPSLEKKGDREYLLKARIVGPNETGVMREKIVVEMSKGKCLELPVTCMIRAK